MNTMMKSNRLQLFSYDIAPCVHAFSTMRHGGVGEGEYSGFNINGFCGDSPANVAANKETLAEALGISTSHIILPHQVHGVDFRVIDSDFMSLPDNVRTMMLDGVDGVFTSVSGICIGVSTADCIPILIYDTENHAACAIHAGWRGTARHIALKAVSEMSMAFHSKPEKLKAVIGPGISLESFEVGLEVYEQFQSAGFDMDSIAKFMDKWHIDLPMCNRKELIAAGIPDENVVMANVDTFTSNDFFSARRQGVKSGRIYTAIIMEDIK